MNISLLVFVVGAIVTTLVASGVALTIREFHVMGKEIRRGHGPHLGPNPYFVLKVKDYKNQTRAPLDAESPR